MDNDKNPDNRVFFIGSECRPNSPSALAVAACFSRFRHDLQNDLQLVSGYLQLQKPTADVLVKLDKVAERVQTASRLFGIDNLSLSCVVYELWGLAEQQGFKFSIKKRGSWQDFGENQLGWASHLLSVWTCYQTLFSDKNHCEILLELTASESSWQICFSAAESVQLTCFFLRSGRR